MSAPRYRYQIRVEPVVRTIPGDETVLEQHPVTHVSYYTGNPRARACTPVDPEVTPPALVVWACERDANPRGILG